MSSSTQSKSSESLRKRLGSVWDGLLGTLYPWQRDWITDRSKLKHIVSSRQIGKTHVIGFEVAIVSALGPTGPLCGRRALIVSKDDDSSKEVLAECLTWIRVLQACGIVSIEGEPAASRIKLSNGVHIVSIPGGRPPAIRGPGGSVWFDEFPYHRDPKENYKAGVGVTTRGGLIRMVSTPWSDGDLFWQIATNHENKYPTWSRHVTTIYDALAVGIIKPDGEPLTLRELQEKQPDTAAFAQEFGCVPISDSESYLGEFLDAARLLYDEKFTSGSTYGGFDVARSANGDFAALAEVRRDGDRFQASPIVWAERGKDFEAMQTEAALAFERHKWQRMGVDSTGIGMETAERLQKKLGTSRVDAVQFTPQEKDKMMTTLRSLLEMGQLALPPDQELLLDLRAIKRMVGQNSVRYDAKHDELRGHADRAWALALAVRAAGKGGSSQPFTFTAVPSRTSKRGW